MVIDIVGPRSLQLRYSMKIWPTAGTHFWIRISQLATYMLMICYVYLSAQLLQYMLTS